MARARVYLAGFSTKQFTGVEAVSSTTATAKAKDTLAKHHAAFTVKAITSPERWQASWNGQRQEQHERQGQEQEHALLGVNEQADSPPEIFGTLDISSLIRNHESKKPS